MTEELFREDAFARDCEATIVGLSDGGVLLDRTVFYSTGGGQPGDHGRLVAGDGTTFEVIDTVKTADGIVHRLAEGATPPPVGTRLRAEIDWPRRHRLMRMHSAMHLLCRAVDCPVTGGQVGEAKSRLDFDVGDTKLDKEAISAKLAAWIADDVAIRHFWIDADELAARPELVRTMSVRPPTTSGRVRLVEIDGLDLQACGGTHVARTGEIGAVAIGL